MSQGKNGKSRAASRLPIRIGSRESELAIIQTRIVMARIARAYPELPLRLVTMKAKGDLHPELALEQAGTDGAKGLFTGVLEQALIRGEVDLCVHSLKDMAEKTGDLPILAVAKRGDPRDTLILPQGQTFEDFQAPGKYTEPWYAGDRGSKNAAAISPVGCSSLRRRLQLLALVPEVRFAPIRGNVPTRLAKLDGGQYGALMLAAAGLERLGISGRKGYTFPVREMIPAAGQGVLAVQGRRGEDYGFLDAVQDPVTWEEAMAERFFIRALGAGCGAPAAVFAQISGNEITILGAYAADRDGPFLKDENSGERRDALTLAEKLALRFLRKGAGL